MQPLRDVRGDRREGRVGRDLGRRGGLPRQPRKQVRVLELEQLRERAPPRGIEVARVPRGPPAEEQVELEEAALPGAVEERVEMRLVR